MGQSPSRTPGEFLKYKKLHYRHIEKVFFEYSSSNMYPTTFNQIQIFQRVVQDHHIAIILLAAVFVFQIARIKMVLDFRRDKLYISGIAVEFIILYHLIYAILDDPSCRFLYDPTWFHCNTYVDIIFCLHLDTMLCKEFLHIFTRRRRHRQHPEKV